MPLTKPYKRTVRPFTQARVNEGGIGKYILHDDYAESPEHYVRAFLIILKDYTNLLDYIEPADKNLQTYSFRVHELLLRACTEFEANCVAILTENGYAKAGNLNMTDYKKIEESHKLSSFEVKIPVWNGTSNLRKPFEKWSTGDSLPWWVAYNKSKHDRHNEFEEATFEHLTDALCGLIVILSAQFEDNDFSPVGWGLSAGGIDDGMKSTIGEYFRIKYPTDWSDDDKYDFKFSELETAPNPFENYDYT